MRVINKLKPSLNLMVNCFHDYLTTTGGKDATFEQVVMSPHGLGWTGTYQEWLNGNHFRNKVMILKWQNPKRANAWHFKKVRRGHYFPTRGNSKYFHTRDTAKTASAKPATVVQPEFDFTPTPKNAMNIRGVLIVPVPSVDRFHSIVDSLNGVLDDPDHEFLANLLKEVLGA